MSAARRAGLATVLPIALWAPNNGGAADWELTPRARVAGEYVDNPQLAPKDSSAYDSSTGDYSGELAAELARHDGRYDLSFTPKVSAVRYPDHGLLNQYDQFLDLGGDWRTERSTWTGSVSGVRDTTLTSELGLSGLTDTNRHHESLQVSAGPSWQATPRLTLSSQLGWQANHYVDARNTGLYDYRYQNGDARAAYAATERTTVSADFAVGQIHTPSLATRITNYSLSLVLTTRLSERWDATLAGGPSRADSGHGVDHGFVYQASTHYVTERSDWSASVARTVTPTGRGVLSRSDQARLNLEHRFTERFSGGLVAEANQNRDLSQVFGFGIVSTRVRYLSLEAHLGWALTPEWSLQLSGRDRRQLTSSSGFPSSMAQGYSGNLAVIWSGRSWPLR